MEPIYLRYAGLVIVAMMLAAGQILFKMSAEKLTLSGGVIPFVMSFISIPFIGALTVYAIATVLWVLLLNAMPLSRAYPFMMLSFAFVPVLTYFLFKEILSVQYFVGLIIMAGGMYLILRS